MKTYKQFKDFVFQEKYWTVRWRYIRQDAIKEGFNKHLFDFYRWVLSFDACAIYEKLKAKLKKVAKYFFFIVAYVGLVAIALNMCALVKSATIRNKTETLAFVVDTCRKAPKLCEYAVMTGKLEPIKKN